MDKYTPYQTRIRECFAKVYKFLDSHKHLRDLEDFKKASQALAELSIANPGTEKSDPLLKALLVAAFEELEREYISAAAERKK